MTYKAKKRVKGQPMKFKSRIFFRFFLVLAFLLVIIGAALSFFMVKHNFKGEVADAKNGVAFLSECLKHGVILDDRTSLQAMADRLADAYPEIAYVFIDRPGKEDIYSGKDYLLISKNRSNILESMVMFHKAGSGVVSTGELKSPEGMVFQDIAVNMGEDADSLHIGLSHDVVDRGMFPQVWLIILLGFFVLAAGAFVIYGIARATEIEVHRAEKALHESEEKYRSLTDQVPVGLYRTTEQGKILYGNPALAAMLGYASVDELLKVPVQNTFVNAGEREKYLNKWKRSKGVLTIENKLLTKDGREIWVRDTGKAVTGKNGELFHFDGIIEDITEQKRAEEENRQLEERLQQAQKMEAIGSLAGGIAHDFNNILGLIIGYSELTMEKMRGEDPNRSNIENVLTACHRGKEMVKHILAFSRKTKKERKALVLGDIIKESLELMRSALPATIEIRRELPEIPGLILVNQTEIHQVIMNLCSNAAHAMREKGGILEVVLKEIELDPAAINRKDLQTGRYQRLTVSDTGHGMTPEIQSRVFDPYFTTKKEGEGTGMGLSVAQGIVKNHGGEITVYSEPGKGTTFQVYLPVIPGEKIPEVEIKADVPRGSEHILFVDDEPGLAQLGKAVLKTLGYSVDSKSDSIEALEAFRREPHRFALVITDQTMPKLTGLQLAAELRRIRPDIPIILCTGFSESIDEENFRSYGVDAFIMKPMIKREVARLIRQVLE